MKDSVKKSRVTIHDVANEASVSIATVSRVINGNYYVGPDVTRRVHRAIAKLDYYPNSVARSLKVASTHMIAFIVSDISNAYFNFVARAIEDAIAPRNYSLIVCSTEGHAESELSHVRGLLGRNVDGFVINTSGSNDDFIALTSRSVPTVLLHRRIKPPDFEGDLVDSGNRNGGAMLAEFLIELGHAEIGVINGPLNLSSGRERFAGFKAAFRSRRGIRVTSKYPYLYAGDFTVASGYTGMEYLLSQTPQITGVVVMNNAMAVGALRYLREKRIRVPQDLSIVSFGDIINWDIMYVRPTIVTLDPVTVGSRAAEFLLSRIQDPHHSRREYIYEPVLRIGDSTGPPRRSERIQPVDSSSE